jgi:hypothetical protein
VDQRSPDDDGQEKSLLKGSVSLWRNLDKGKGRRLHPALALSRHRCHPLEGPLSTLDTRSTEHDATPRAPRIAWHFLSGDLDPRPSTGM